MKKAYLYFYKLGNDNGHYVLIHANSFEEAEKKFIDEIYSVNCTFYDLVTI